MKVMILAAGRGERMGALTENTPKPLLTVKGQYLIEQLILSLKGHGFREFVINVAYRGQQIIDVLKSGEQYGVSIQYSIEADKGLETGGGIFQALPLLGKEHFLVVNADVWTDYPFQSLRDKTKSLAHLVLVNNPEHHAAGDFSLQQGLVIKKAKLAHTYSGIGVYHPDVFIGEKAGFFPLAPILRRNINNARVTGELYTGVWSDVGTPARLAALNC